MERARQVSISVLCLAFPVLAIQSACHEKQVSAVVPLAVYFAYTLGVATILAMIAQRLYVMHEVRRFVFDMASWFMLVGLLSMPLGIANMLASWLVSVEPDFDADKVQAWTVMVAVSLYFLVLPVFFVTEAIMALAVVVARKVRGRFIKNGR